MRLIGGLLAAAFLLIGCGSDLAGGSVVSKDSRGAYDSFVLIPIFAGESCTEIGKSEVCSPRYTYIPERVHHDPQWWVVIHDGDKSATKYVDQITWNNTPIGGWYGPTPTP